MSLYTPTQNQAATTTTPSYVEITVQASSAWSIQVDLGGATADLVIYGAVHRGGAYVNISEGDLSGSTGSIIQTGTYPLDKIKVAWANLSGGSIKVFSHQWRLDR